MSFVNFIEADGKQILRNNSKQYCFSAVFGGAVRAGTTEILVYQPQLNPQFSEPQVAEWLSMMNALNFWITDLGVDSPEAKKYNLPENYRVFYVDATKQLQKNHLLSTLTLARYLWEYSEPDFNDGEDFGNSGIPEAFFKIRAALPKMPLFKALLLSFLYKNKGRTIHSCSNTSKRVFITEEQLFAEFNKRCDIYTGGSDLFGCWDCGKAKSFTITKDYKEMYKIMNNLPQKTKVYVVGGDNNYANWLPDVKLVKTLKCADIVLFTGGEDVDPSFYGEPKNARTGSNIERDIVEKKIYQQATKLGLKKLGICRGSQFLCVMNGGKLVQHQENPAHIHAIKTDGYGELRITSTHHQAALPYPTIDFYKYKIIGWTHDASKIHLDGNNKEVVIKDGKECEIVHYIDGKSLGIQGHPEFPSYQRDPANKESLEAFKTIFTNFINDKL